MLYRRTLKRLPVSPIDISVDEVAHKCLIDVDENDPECVKGRKLAERIFTTLHSKSSTNTTLKSLLPLQGRDHWHEWASLDKEQYR